RSKRSGPARSRAPRSAQSPRSLASSSAVSDPGASLAAMAAAAGLRALGAKGSGWLRRGPWPPLTAGFCSGGPAGVGRPEPGSRPTSTRQRDGIRSVVLSDPKRRNALSLATLRSPKRHSSRSRKPRSEGHYYFRYWSGHDADPDPPGPHHRVVNGLATAAGCQLVASCDIAVASDKSSFAMPGVNIGLFCSTPGVALGRAVLRKVALEVLFTGEPVSAREALLHGLLSRVVPEDETTQMAKKVASPDQPVLSLGKATLYGQLARDLRTACHLTSQVMVDNLGLPDAQEGVKAFLQKRKPV
ncbi:hypothetical protein EI555_016293, partial [Monodon monoceros]